MSLFDKFINDIFGLTPNLFEFFLINSIYAGILGFFVILIKIIIPKLTKNTEYFLWCLVLIRLILPNDLSFEFSIGELIQSSFSQDLALSLSASEWLNKMAVSYTHLTLPTN